MFFLAVLAFGAEKDPFSIYLSKKMKYFEGKENKKVVKLFLQKWNSDTFSKKDKELMTYFISDFENRAFNQDYYIIGTYKAKQWLGSEVFDVIETIREYEQSNFGQVSTDFSDPEKVANMIAYILGEEILSDSDVYQQLQKDGDTLDEIDLDNLAEDLKESIRV